MVILSSGSYGPKYASGPLNLNSFAHNGADLDLGLKLNQGLVLIGGDPHINVAHWLEHAIKL